MLIAFYLLLPSGFGQPVHSSFCMDVSQAVEPSGALMYRDDLEDSVSEYIYVLKQDRLLYTCIYSLFDSFRAFLSLYLSLIT